MNYLATTILIIILLVNICFIIWSIVEFKKDWSIISGAWKKMEPFEKRLFYMGLLFFAFIPIFKEHPSADWYISKVTIEILPALAGSFFVAGVLAFMRQVHEMRENKKKNT